MFNVVKTESVQNVVEFMKGFGIAVEVNLTPKLKRPPVKAEEPEPDEETELKFLKLHMTNRGQFINLKKHPELNFYDVDKKKGKIKTIHRRKSVIFAEPKGRRATFVRGAKPGKVAKEKKPKEKEKKERNLPGKASVREMVKGKVKPKADPYVVDLNPLAKKMEDALLADKKRKKVCGAKRVLPQRENESFYEGIPLVIPADEDDLKPTFQMKSETILSINSESDSNEEGTKVKDVQEANAKKIPSGKMPKKSERKLAEGQYYLAEDSNEEVALEQMRIYPDYWEWNEPEMLEEEKCDLECLNLLDTADIKFGILDIRIRKTLEREEREGQLIEEKKRRELKEQGIVEYEPEDYPAKDPDDEAISLEEKDEHDLYYSRLPLRLIMDNIPRMAPSYPDVEIEFEKWLDIFETRRVRDDQKDWDMDFVTLPYDEEVQLMVAYYNKERRLLKRKRIELKKKKTVKGPLIQVKECRMIKTLKNMDPEYPWNARIFKPSKQANSMPIIRGHFYEIFEFPNRYVSVDSWLGKIAISRGEHLNHGLFEKPTKNTTAIKDMIINMYSVFIEAKMSPEEVCLYLFQPLFPEGTPGPKNIAKHLKKFIRATQKIYDIFGSPPRTPELSYSDDGAKKELSSSEIEIEEEIYEEETEEDATMAAVAAAAAGSTEPSGGEEEVVEEEETGEGHRKVKKEKLRTESSLIFEYLKDEYATVLKSQNSMCFDAIITPQVKKTVTVSTLTNIKCMYPGKNSVVNANDIVQLYVKDFHEKELSKKVVNPLWLLITLIKSRSRWRDPPQNAKILNKRRLHKMMILLNRVTNMFVEFPLIFGFFRIRFGGENERRRSFRKIWSLRYRKVFWPVVDVQWHPFDRSLIFILLAKFDTVKKHYGALDNGKGYLTAFELQYRHCPCFVHWIKVSPTCMAIHPRLGKYVLVGQIDGKVRMYNMGFINNEKYNQVMIADTKLFSSVIQLEWFDSKYKGEDLTFFSVVEHGVVHKWKIHRTYMRPIIHLKLTLETGVSLGIVPDFKPVMITCAAFHPDIPKEFLLGTMSGDVLKCSTEKVNRPIFTYKAEYYVSLIKYNVLVPKVFITCNLDQIIQVWEEKTNVCLYFFQIEEEVIHLEWAPFSSTVFITAHKKALFVFDICLTSSGPEEMENVLDLESKEIITKFSFCYGKKYILAVADSGGEISFLKIAPDIRGIMARTGAETTVPTWTVKKERAKLQEILCNVSRFQGNLEAVTDDTTSTTDNSELETNLSTNKGI